MTIPWWGYCAFLVFGMSAYGIALRFVDEDIHPSLFAAGYTGVSSVLLLALVFVYVLSGSVIETTPFSLGAAVIGGLALVAVDRGIIAMYKAGAPVSLGMPIIRTVLALSTALIGVLFLHEEMDFMKAGGIALSSVGIFLAVHKG